MSEYDTLKEYGIINIEKLFCKWGIKFTRVTSDEYDFLNPKRKDTNFGAVRFNVKKGIGGDFTGSAFTKENFKVLGDGFDESDFIGVSVDKKTTHWGFDIIGLCQKLHDVPTYRDAALKLKEDLKYIREHGELLVPSEFAAEKRKKDIADARDKTRKIAQKIWDYCDDYTGSLADTYLKSRCIFLPAHEDSIKFHYKVLCYETKSNLPAVIFRVSKEIAGPLTAIHRIYLDEKTATKAKIKNPKMALGSVQGCAIWFGHPSSTLCIAEGPENALSILSLGYKFVCSSINAGNMPNLTIPPYVRKIIIFADRGKAGETAAEKSILAYTSQAIQVKVKYPDKGDWNDMLKEAHSNVIR